MICVTLTCFTSERCLKEGDVSVMLLYPPVWPLSLQYPLGVLESYEDQIVNKIVKISNFMPTMLIHSLTMKAPRNFIPFRQLMARIRGKQMMNPLEGSPMEEMGIIKSLRAESRSWRDDRNVASLRYIFSIKFSSNNVMAGFLWTTVTVLQIQSDP